MNGIELLSPAGDMDSLIAAARTGANAVYLGFGNFNARRNAANFTEEEFARAAQYLRVRGIKCYVTLNTLVRDDELQSAAELAVKAARLGADAFIVQDIGLAGAISNVLPGFPLHASTQMAANSPAALPYIKQLGFNRVVSARELSSAQLKLMCTAGKDVGVEVETFVHGALCVCLSGQCYLSAAVGGRSANRGMCAGACRLPFGVNNPNEYALSLKDLSLVDNISQLSQMGVASLKIEGRMKDAEYVAAATAVCRAAIDGEAQNPKLLSLLSQIFSRGGFTNKYFTGVGGTMQGVRKASDLALSRAAGAQIHELYRAERPSVTLNARFTAKANTPCELWLSDGTNSVSVKGEIPQPAKNLPLSSEYALQKLKKSGNTPFAFANFDCRIDKNISLSASALGDLRRTALLQIQQARAALPDIKVLPLENTVSETARKSPQKIIVRLEETSQLPANLAADAVVIPAGDKKPDFKGEIMAELSRRLLPEELLLKRLRVCKEQGIEKILCNNIQSVQLVKNAGLIPVYGPFMNVFNSRSLAAAKQNGAAAATLSFELSLSQADNVKGGIPRGLMVYGNLPLMLMYTCPKDGTLGCRQTACGLTLTDRTNAQFPVICKDGARELLNCKPLWMADKLAQLKGCDFLLLYFTTEPKETVLSVANAYKNGAPPPKDFTRGLYYRAVK